MGCSEFKGDTYHVAGHLVNMQVRITYKEPQIQKHLLLLSMHYVTVFPFDSDNDTWKPMSFLLTDKQIDLTELTSEVIQLIHFPIRMQIQV